VPEFSAEENMPLPEPIGRQKQVIWLPANGHHVVLGTAGSGKTTMAIHRAADLANPESPHAGRTLLVTFNKTLVAYLRSIGDERLGNVTTEHYHLFARGYLAGRGRMGRYGCILGHAQRPGYIERAMNDIGPQHLGAATLFSRPAKVIDEEVGYIERNGVATLDDYAAMERIGRQGFRADRELHRPALWAIYRRYLDLRGQDGKLFDWDDIASAVCEEFAGDETQRRYKHVVIDEGQDFSPEMLRSLVAAVPEDGSVTFFGDVAQQIYGRGLSWRSAGLRLTAVPWEFKENYRNSRQIARLALAIAALPCFAGEPDIVAPNAPRADGPLPTVVRFSSGADEIAFVTAEANRLGRTQSVAVLCRTRAQARAIGRRLQLPRIQLHDDCDVWPDPPARCYGTLHAGKGLEFPAVILPFCSEDELPEAESVALYGMDEALADDGRRFYVGVTRARSRLIITCTGRQSPLLPADGTLYQVEQR
jgi:superfamily I DNA/RNA helicase